jgi:hypothetical protein
MKSTIGRPRVLTDEQVARIFKWHDALLKWKARRKLITLRQLAKELGVTHGAITSVLRQRGVKQPSPEDRKAEMQNRSEQQLKPARQRTRSS